MSYSLTVQIKSSYQAAGKGEEDPFARAILSVPLQFYGLLLHRFQAVLETLLSQLPVELNNNISADMSSFKEMTCYS